MKKWALPLGISLSGALLWWIHKVLTNVFPPFDNVFDTVLWIVCSLLKLATIIWLPIALGRVFIHCHRNLGKTASAMAVWGLALVLLLIALSLVRAPLIAQLNNDSSRFFPNSMDAPHMEVNYSSVDVEAQVVRWQSGLSFFLELGLVVIGILSLGHLGFYAGNTGLKAGIAAVVWLGILFIAGSLVLKLLIWDYDIFFAGTMVAPLSVDILTPFMAFDPTTEIGLLVYATIIWTSWLLDTRIIGRDSTATDT